MKGDSLLAFVAGAAVGVALGLWLASDKGEETKKLKEDVRKRVLGGLERLESALEDDSEGVGTQSENA